MAGGKGKSRALPVAATPNGFNGAGPSGAGPPEDDELPPEFRVIEAPPPPEPAWEEVGARRKGRRPPLKEDGEDTKEGSGGAASGAATATRAAPGKKPATTDDQGQGGTTAARKAKAKPPSLLPIESAGSPVDHDSSNGDKGSPGTKKGKKPPKELLKAELQAKCTALLQELAKDAGYLPIEELDKAVASALDVPLWEQKHRAAHGPMRSFLSRCPGIAVATVDQEERAYLVHRLDAAARAAIHLEKASAKALSSPKKRAKGGPARWRRNASQAAPALRWALRLLLCCASARLAMCACGLPYLGCSTPSCAGGGDADDAPPPAALSPACLLADASTAELRSKCLTAWNPMAAALHEALSHLVPPLGHVLRLPGCSYPYYGLLRWLAVALCVLCVALLAAPFLAASGLAVVYASLVYAGHAAGLPLSPPLAALALLAALTAAVERLLR